MRRSLRCLGLTVLGLVAAMALYVGVAVALLFWPLPGDSPPATSEVEAYVLSNGVHTDYVFPVRSGAFDWATVFDARDARAVPPDAEFVAIGWGDREFYLHTPTWADLTASRALGALVGRNASLLHVTWLTRAQLRQGAYGLPLTQPQYLRLVGYVRATLEDGGARPLVAAGYGAEDAFYAARGSYHLFETCNTWTGRGLRTAGVSMGRWTPFDFTVVAHLRAMPPG